MYTRVYGRVLLRTDATDRHQLYLARSGIPQIAVVTTFELLDTQTEEYRWAWVDMGIREIVTKPQLQKALDARAQLTENFPRLT